MRPLLIAVSLAATVSFGLRQADAESNKRFAVLATDATLFDAPSEEATRVALAGKKLSGFGYDVEVLGTNGAFTKVRTLENGHCYESFDELESIALTMYVKTSDLVPVLSQQVSLDLGDGQRLELLPGLRIEGNVIRSGEVSVEIAGIEKLAAVSYSVAGEPFSRPALNAQIRPMSWGFADLAVSTTATTKIMVGATDPRVALLQRRCLRFHFVVRANQYTKRPTSGEQAMSSSTLAALGAERAIQAYSQLTWPSGKAAGKTRSAVQLLASELVPRQKRKCFKRRMVSREVTLCVAGKRVRPAKSTFGWVAGSAGGGSGSWGKLASARVEVTRITISAAAVFEAQKVALAVRGQDRALLRCHAKFTSNINTIPKRVIVTLRVRIDKSGRARQVRVIGNTNASKRLGKCVARTVRSIRFPNPTNSTATARIPIAFVAP